MKDVVLFVDCEGIGVVLHKITVWRAFSMILPIHVTSEAMDLSAKFQEWTMQGFQKICKSNKSKYK